MPGPYVGPNKQKGKKHPDDTEVAHENAALREAIAALKQIDIGKIKSVADAANALAALKDVLIEAVKTYPA